MSINSLLECDIRDLSDTDVVRRVWYKWMSHSDPSYDWIFDAYGGGLTDEVTYISSRRESLPASAEFLVGYMASITSWLFMNAWGVDDDGAERVASDWRSEAARRSERPMFEAMNNGDNSLALSSLKEMENEDALFSDDGISSYFERVLS